MSPLIGPVLARAVTASLDERDALDDDDDDEMDDFKLQQQIAQFNDAQRAAADEEKKEHDAAQAIIKNLVG